MQKSNLLFGMSESYGENSLAQDECHDLAKLYLEKSANSCCCNNTNFSVGVFGCGPYDNDIHYLNQYVFPIIEERFPNQKIDIFMIDIAETKWSQSKITKFNDKINIHGIVSDVYQIILPNNSLDLIISFSCLHWLSEIPFNSKELKDIYSWSFLNTNQKKILRDYLDKQLSIFLNCRYHELRKGGQIIVTFDGEVTDENHQYQGPTDYLSQVLINLNLKEELKNLFIPTGPRRLDNVVSCVKKSSFAIGDIIIKKVDCPIWEKKVKNNSDNTNKTYATEITNAILSCMSPIIERFIGENKLKLVENNLIDMISNNPIEKSSTSGNMVLIHLIKDLIKD